MRFNAWSNVENAVESVISGNQFVSPKVYIGFAQAIGKEYN
jgi:ABC-type thiamin/hydroxymethylpyrimidine transport system permease subunit